MRSRTPRGTTARIPSTSSAVATPSPSAPGAVARVFTCASASMHHHPQVADQLVVDRRLRVTPRPVVELFAKHAQRPRVVELRPFDASTSARSPRVRARRPRTASRRLLAHREVGDRIGLAQVRGVHVAVVQRHLARLPPGATPTGARSRGDGRSRRSRTTAPPSSSTPRYLHRAVADGRHRGARARVARTARSVRSTTTSSSFAGPETPACVARGEDLPRGARRRRRAPAPPTPASKAVGRERLGARHREQPAPVADAEPLGESRSPRAAP